jgi:hypothetical protein
LSRRVSLPAADDLFRPTARADEADGQEKAGAQAEADGRRASVDDAEADSGPKKPSGRVRHDEKMTVYVTSDELLDIEHTRLVLRRSHGLAVDRGRLVREAVALVLADFEDQGADSALVRRLTEE